MTFKEMLLKNFNVTLTPRHVDLLERHCVMFEIRDNNPEALNTSLLGVTKMYFYPKDSQAVFDIFGIDSNRFKNLVQSWPEVDLNHKVASDPYNIFTIWMSYLVTNSSLSREQKERMKFRLFTLLQYKFFTSVVNHCFPYPPNIGIMQKTVENLSAKYDIKSPETPTWRLVIEARSKDIFSQDSIHFETIRTLSSWKDLAYVLSDIQTRLRVKILNVVGRFHETLVSKDNSVKSDSIVQSIDGEKDIKAVVASFDTMITTLSNDVLSVNRFINHDSIDIVCKLTTNISTVQMKNLLIKFSDIASLQYRKGEKDKVIGSGPTAKIVGYNMLISKIIQKTYRSCILDKVDTSVHLKVLRKAENLFKSSRIIDQDILIIKNSVDAFCEEYGGSKRPSTIASLKIGLIMYIILLSFSRQ